jgi:hypothetical protein
MKKNHRIFNIILLTAVIFIVISTFVYLKFFKDRITVINATLPEEIVFAKSNDDILNAGVVNAGVVFNAKKEIAKPIAIIWVHGWGVNF